MPKIVNIAGNHSFIEDKIRQSLLISKSDTNWRIMQLAPFWSSEYKNSRPSDLTRD